VCNLTVSVTGPLEAVLFAAGSNGLSTEELAHVLQLSLQEVSEICEALKNVLDNRHSGLSLVEFGGTWQLVTKAEFEPYLRKMATAPTSGTLSTASLEALAVVAYKEPITRAGIESIRGVQSDRAIHTLVHKQLIREIGREDAPGRPILYGTTEHFLQTFGLRSLEDLPPLPPEPEGTQIELSLFQIAPTLARD
jgi:segregation and condensation protein B